MKMEDIDEFYDEVCFKAINGFRLNDTEKEFFKAYFYLFFWANELSSLREKELEDLLKDFGLPV